METPAKSTSVFLKAMARPLFATTAKTRQMVDKRRKSRGRRTRPTERGPYPATSVESQARSGHLSRNG